MCQTTLIKGLSFHQRTEEEDTCVRRLSSKDSPFIKGLRRRIHVSDDSHQRTLIKGLSSSYFNHIVGNMHKDTSVCVSLTHLRALSIECVLYVAHEEDLRL
jgi:hypothetical protein